MRERVGQGAGGQCLSTEGSRCDAAAQPSAARTGAPGSAGAPAGCALRRVRRINDTWLVTHQLYASAWISCGCPTTVLPDGCVDVVHSDGQLLVAGPGTGPVPVPASAERWRFGVRLRIGAVEAALGVPADALRNADVPLGEVASPMIRDRILRASERGPRAGLNELVRQLTAVHGGGDPDLLVRLAADRLAAPQARLGAVARELGLSERQLRRRFDRTVGYGWRTFSRVQRLQRLLVLSVHAPSRPLADLSLAAGYADQAHMSRDVVRLSGMTPTALLSSGARPAGETAGTFKTCGRAGHMLPA